MLYQFINYVNEVSMVSHVANLRHDTKWVGVFQLVDEMGCYAIIVGAFWSLCIFVLSDSY